MTPFPIPQNITLKRLGPDGDSADAIARTIIKAVDQAHAQLPHAFSSNLILCCSLSSSTPLPSWV
jgi:hypothetical protein